jgi:hypothetical protein
VDADDGEGARVALGERSTRASRRVRGDGDEGGEVVVEGGGEVVAAVEVAVGVDHGACYAAAGRRAATRRERAPQGRPEGPVRFSSEPGATLASTAGCTTAPVRRRGWT